MKRFIRIFLPLIVFFALIYTGYRMVELSRQQKNRAEEIVHIPPFELKDVQNEHFRNTNLKAGVPVVFFYFNSECEFCQAEMQDIVSNIKQFDGIQLVFVSYEPIQKIILFQISNKLDIYDNVIFLSDYRNTFSETFGVENLPSSLVYNKEGVLVSKNNEAVKVDYLLKLLKKNEIR